MKDKINFLYTNPNTNTKNINTSSNLINTIQNHFYILSPDWENIWSILFEFKKDNPVFTIKEFKLNIKSLKIKENIKKIFFYIIEDILDKTLKNLKNFKKAKFIIELASIKITQDSKETFDKIKSNSLFKKRYILNYLYENLKNENINTHISEDCLLIEVFIKS